jgi:RNA polymerase sigma factor (TIGR02999 family)
MEDLPPADAALRALTESLHADLKRLARSQRSRLRPGDTLQTTALVNEAYLKLTRMHRWESREHFMNAAARAMRQVLVDYARTRLAAKRGGGVAALELDEELVMLRGESPERVLALNDALARLGELSERLEQVVEMRYFAGFSEEETASILGVTDRTVRRDWIKAKAWLYREIGAED